MAENDNNGWIPTSGVTSSGNPKIGRMKIVLPAGATRVYWDHATQEIVAYGPKTAITPTSVAQIDIKQLVAEAVVAALAAQK